ncbi:MAG: hypothetical protein LW832_09580 [Parachlamydia sp.]|jgi:hypothetical protein|nr:hypothetical protein [Parachlamydia sp.]
MKPYLFAHLFALSFSLCSLEALKPESFMEQTEQKIFINNRILARVNGKPLSTFDIVKKLDVTFFRQYPEYASSSQARFQYYQVNWKYALDELINKELILADAKESKIEVSGGDVRQEIEETFGPNIIANLDKIGISYDEASKMIEGDILLKRMIGSRVNGKALRLVTPSKVRQAYDDFLQNPDNARLTIWNYRAVTVKDRSLEKAEEVANAAYGLLMEGVAMDDLIPELKKRKLIGRRGKVTVSNVIKNNEKELSAVYRDVLNGMENGMLSQPFAHKSRAEHATVYRILFVQDKQPGSFPSFKEMENVLKERLLNDVADQETEFYIQKLRQHYHLRESDLEGMIPPVYQPFILI